MPVVSTWSPWAIALAVVVAFLLIAAVAYFVYRLLSAIQKWIWLFLNNLWAGIKSLGQRLKRLFNRFCRTLLPYPHSVFKTLIYAVLILLVSLAAPQLTSAIGEILSLMLPKECEVLRNCLTISVVAGSSTGLLFIFLREKPLSFANRILARLSGSANPDGPRTPHLVLFSPYGKALRISEDKREYLSIEHASTGVDEWMIVLPQIGASRHKYTTECLEQQLARVQQCLDAENSKRKRNCGKTMLTVKWVCFVSSGGGFQAFQPFKTFCFHMRVKHNARYAAILNTTTEQDLAKAIQIEIDLSNKHKITDASGVEREAFVPDAIPDLDTTWIRQGAANDEVLEVLIEENKGKAMLIAGCGSTAPIGVLTSTELAKLVLYEPLNSSALYHPHVAVTEKGKLFGDTPP